MLEVEDLSRAGSGVARHPSGKIVFIPYTAPGDQVEVRVEASESRYLTGTLIRIVKASTMRVEPRCRFFARCGGCDWQHLPYEQQWKTKISGIRHAG